MNIAYLINQYPQPSHTFIRREIAALQAAGQQVDRYTLRRWPGTLLDPNDRAEQTATRAVLEGGKFAAGLRLSQSVISTLLSHPLKFFAAFRTAMSLGANSDRGRIVSLIYLAEACVLARWMKSRQTAHVHAHFGTNSTTVALLISQLGGPPFSFTVHGPEEFEKPDLLKLREKVRMSSFVVVISEFGRMLLQQSSDQKNWGKIKVVRCGLDSQFLSASRLQDRILTSNSSNRLVCVGRLSEQKGHPVLLEAAAQLAAEGINFELVLVGDGEMRNEIEQRIQTLNLTQHVRLTGWLGSDGVRKEIAAARALVLASRAEGLPVVLMESMALGKPVVATRVAGVPELVTDKIHGRLVPPGDPSALADAMKEILQLNSAELNQMGQAAIAQVSRLHDIQIESAKLAAHFTDAANSPLNGV